MAELNDWDVVDANNNSAPPDGWPENTMNYSEVNDTGRAVQGKIKRYFADVNGSLACAGTANTYTVTLNAGYTAYFDGLYFVASIPATNTSASTLNVNSLGAKTIVDLEGNAVGPGQLQAGSIYNFYYDGTNINVLNLANLLDRATTSRALGFTNAAGAEAIYFYGNAISTDYDVGMYDDKNARGVWLYDESANNFNFETTTLQHNSSDIERINRETVQATASGTNISFTGFPTWVKKITVMFDQVGNNLQGTSRIRLGDSGGIEPTGYAGTVSRITAAGTAIISSTSGSVIAPNVNSQQFSGQVVINNITGNVWVASGIVTTNNTGTAIQCASSYSKTLSSTLTQLDIDLASGTYNNGQVNVLIEG